MSSFECNPNFILFVIAIGNQPSLAPANDSTNL